MFPMEMFFIEINVLNCPLGLCSWEMLFVGIKCVELPLMVMLFMAMFFIQTNVSNLHL